MHPPRSRTLVLCLLSALAAMPALAATHHRAKAVHTTAPTAAPAPVEDLPSDPQEARRELEQRVLEQPGDVRSRLALAQLLASQPDTLRSGIVQLSQLARDRSVGSEAIGSWRGALAMAGSDRSDIPLYQAYLKVRPKDTAIRMRLAAIQRGAAVPGIAGAPMAAAPVAAISGTSVYVPPVVLQPAGAASAPSMAYIPAPVLGTPPAAPRSALLPRDEVAISDIPPRNTRLGSTSYAASAADYPVAPVSRTPDAPGQAELRGLQNEISDIESSRGRPEITAGVVTRSRKGENGMSSLTDTEVPMQLKMDVGDGMLTASITPTYLHTGAIDTSFNSISRFGGGPVVATAQPGVSAGSQNASGVGVGLGYEQGNLAVDVGTTPIGFQYTDAVGGVRYRVPVNEQLSLTMSLSRRALTDSVLSFAGARDARTGQEWGGVTANGGRIDANYDRGDYGLYAYGGLARILGHEVESNTRVEYGAGIYWRVIKQTDSSLTAGLALSGLAFDKNLSYYTFGQGGYFSPKQFASLGIPVDWQQRNGRLSYELKGSLGVQYLKQNASDYFPTDATQQAAAAAASTAVYGASSKTGLGYGLSAAMEYQLEPQWFVGGKLGIDNSRDYRQYAGALYVRYAFKPYEGPQIMPVNPVRSPYGS